jgi:hypothetical protein
MADLTLPQLLVSWTAADDPGGACWATPAQAAQLAAQARKQFAAWRASLTHRLAALAAASPPAGDHHP